MRIVAHTCSNTEIVCALGRADWLVGVDDHSDYPADVVADLPRIGPDLNVEIDRIRALKPDLVITSLTVPGHERCVARIRDAGLRHLVTQPTSLRDVANDIERIGEALDARNQARALAEPLRERADAKPVRNRTPVLIEWWPKPVIVPGARSWVNEMLQCAGGINPFAAIEAESHEISAAQAERAAPEAIVMSWCGVTEDKYRPHIVRRREGWESVPAVRNNRIFAISEAWLGRPGPRLVDGVDKLREVVQACAAGTPVQ